MEQLFKKRRKEKEANMGRGRLLLPYSICALQL
jgi:hypothetical protein